LLGELRLELCRWTIAERGVKAPGVVDVFDEPGQSGRDVLERLMTLSVFMKLSACALS
jgi:hypothetical protein